MVFKCCVPNCRGNYDTANKVHVFKFPQDEHLRSKWIRGIKRNDFEPTKNSVVCHLHFMENDILWESKAVDSKTGKTLTVPLTKPQLTTVPCKLSNCPSYLNKTSTVHREAPSAKKEKREARALQTAIANSLSTLSEFRKKYSFQTFDELIERLSHVSIGDKWSVLNKNQSVIFLDIDSDKVPHDIVYIIIDEKLNVSVFLGGYEINCKDIPKVVSSIPEIENIMKTSQSFMSERTSTHQYSDIIVKLMDNLNCGEKKQKTVEFLKSQVHLCVTPPERHRFDSKVLIFASLLFFISAHAYKFIRSYGFIILPHPNTIRKLCGYVNVDPSSENFLSYMKDKVPHLEDHERVVTLMLDEIHLKPYLDYKGGNVVGMAYDTAMLATTAHVFMIQGVISSLKDVVNILPVNKMTADKLFDVTKNVVVGLEKLGLGLKAGLLRTRRGDFWVEPARGHDPVEAAPSSRPHLVFKRAAVSAAAKKRKRKKRKRMEKNCGTKEPPHHELKLRRKHLRSRARGRRSTSRESHVEALLVADTAMLRFHQDVEKYILTIMNMVSALYLDPSIGNPINVVVVNIMLLESAEESLNITVNADQTLENFCRWQQELNSPDDADALHHDVAILITREDICARQNAPCSTLGVAHVAGMCQPNRSCNVNEDNGITLAHTITHELGHNFGMYHDTEKIGCSRRHGKTLHVMTPSFEADTVDVAWSTCSKRDITNFLDQGLGGCLNDDPGAVNYSYPDQPPGATYNAQQQCRMQFGIHNTSVCSPLEDICKSLWCVVEGMCTTIMRPAAPGTSCGNNMWCQNQECVPVEERPEPVNGGWSEWTPWSDCSRTCGAGVAITERFCNQPVPAHGGKFCTGERRRYKVCNVEDCPDGQPSFRAVQCSKYDDQEYNGKKYKWLPYLDKSEPCKLYCTDATEHVILPWNNSVADGTPCYVGDRSMCINGICRHVGCDWVVDSTAEEDRCGICQGDGKQCETKSGLYHRKDGLGYKEVVTIPSGSRHIKVEERGNAKGFISIGSATSGKFYLNDLRHVQLAGEYEVAGTPALYERQRGQESIHIPGPIKDDVRIYVISKGRARNGSVHYEYTVPKTRTSEAPVYHWAFSAWSQCTASCGSGTQMSLPVCYEEGIGRVSEEFCEASERPNQMMRVCNEMPCPSRWWTGEWQPCPVTCGEEAFRKRHILCVSQDHGNSSEEVVLSDSECADEDRPTDEEPCPDLPSCFSLAPTQESRSTPHNASAEMMLLDEDEIILNSISSPRNHDDILQFMNGGQGEDRTLSGGGWLVSPWSPCTVTCGPGRQVRHVECTHLDGSCDEALKPSDSKPCHVQRYCYVHWVTGPWGSCSATCGSRPAFKWREVRCENIMTGRTMDGCNILMKPDVREACNLPACPAGEDDAESCEDKLLPRLCASLRTRCNWWYMKAKCCRTCMGR